MSTPGLVLPTVSICMITYGHEKYIAQAIESVLAQETTFSYELVIGEDASPDATRAIVVGYQQRYPDRIRLLLRETNLGITRNFVDTLSQCRGEYVAFLEGDDYWTSSQKLERQVRAMTDDPQTVICFHSTSARSEDSQEVIRVYPDPRPQAFEYRELLRWNFIPTCTAMVRRSAIGEFPDWYFENTFADWPLHILTARHGRIRFLPEVMSVYRVHAGGAWTGRDEVAANRDFIRLFRNLEKHLDAQYSAAIRDTLFDCYARLVRALLAGGHIAEARESAKMCLTLLPPHRRLRPKVAIVLRAYAPRFSRLLQRLKPK